MAWTTRTYRTVALSCLLKFTTHSLKVNCVLQRSGREKASRGKMTYALSVEATQHCLGDGRITGRAILFCHHLFIDSKIVWMEPQWFFFLCFTHSWMTYSIPLRYLSIMYFAMCSPLMKSSTITPTQSSPSKRNSETFCEICLLSSLMRVRWLDWYHFSIFQFKYIICKNFVLKMS